MRLHHFETLRPVCPVCRTSAATFPLTISRVLREAAGHIVEAVLHCGNPQCQREYPVLDGIPLLLGNLRPFIAENALRLLTRQDLSPEMESLIGDCCGPGSDFDTVRQQVSAYTSEHYGEFDPGGLEREDEGRGGTMLAALNEGMAIAGPIPDGPVLDVGCGPGRGSLSLAGRTGEMVLGVDLHFPMLRVASRLLREGVVRYDRRRVGLVYDRREFPVPRAAATEQVDFWLCDATALPFAEGTFSLVAGLNVLDSIYAPLEFLRSVAGVLRGRGKVILTTPYDWSSGATPLEGWLGGHSQRSAAAGSSAGVLRSLLTPGASSPDVGGLRLTAERDGLPWQVRLHDRATMEYRLHLVVATRDDPPAQ